MARSRPGWFPSNVERREIPDAIAPHPVAVYEVGAADINAGLGLTGHSGTARVGQGIGSGSRWGGYLVTPVIDIGPVGASLNVRTSPNKAFPATSGPNATDGSVLSSLAALPQGGGRG